MKCLRAIVPLEVAKAGGEAATDQEMAHLLLAEEGLEPLRSQPSRSVASPFFLPLVRADPARSNGTKTVQGTDLGHGGHFCTPPWRAAANVRAGTGTGPRFGHRVPKSGPTGWAIPPDPQQARGGQIPVRRGPQVPKPISFT